MTMASICGKPISLGTPTRSLSYQCSMRYSCSGPRTQISEKVTFSSVLPLKCRQALENLLFFNGNQALHQSQIMNTVEKYGLPRITEDSDRLRVEVDGAPGAQALYTAISTPDALALVGVVVFTRKAEGLSVLYVAVSEEYSMPGPKAHQLLFFRMVDQLCDIGRRILGIKELVFSPGCSREIHIPVRRTPFVRSTACSSDSMSVPSRRKPSL